MKPVSISKFEYLIKNLIKKIKILFVLQIHAQMVFVFNFQQLQLIAIVPVVIMDRYVNIGIKIYFYYFIYFNNKNNSLSSNKNCITTTTTAPIPNCVDINSYLCRYYLNAIANFCSRNNYISGVSVITYCAKSCNSCNSG